MTDTVSTKRAESVAGRLVAQALAAESFSDDVIAKAKLCLIDYLACTLEALHLPWAMQAAALATPVEGGSTLIGRDIHASSADAAFANAVAGHGLVREDMHTGSIAHLGVVVWPAVMAVAARERASGQDLLHAAVVGYEVGGRIGRSLITADLARLFRPTGLIGPMAAAMSVSRLERLNLDQALSAFALAANTSCGLNQWPHTGGSEMYFHPGFAVQNGILAVRLARFGAIASADILEGEAGIFRAYARGACPSDIVLFPGGQAEILAVFNKPVPACNFAQTPCQAALAARQKANTRKIERIHIAASAAALHYPGCNAFGPFSYPLQAKMSIPFGVAATVARGVIEEDNYTELNNPEIRRLISVTTLEADPIYTRDFPGKQGSKVTLSLADGTEVSEALPDVVPADADLIRSRFRTAGVAVLGDDRTKQIEECIDELETVADAGRLDALCSKLTKTSAILSHQQTSASNVTAGQALSEGLLHE
jgi:2-methylcitrate dehydratase PrpD